MGSQHPMMSLSCHNIRSQMMTTIPIYGIYSLPMMRLPCHRVHSLMMCQKRPNLLMFQVRKTTVTKFGVNTILNVLWLRKKIKKKCNESSLFSPLMSPKMVIYFM